MERGVTHYREGHPVAALRALRGVRTAVARSAQAEEPRSLEVVAKALMRESAPAFELTGDLTASLALLEEASALAARIGDPGLEVKIRGQRALVTLRSGDTRGALRAFDAAAELLEEADLLDRSIVMLNRGALHLEHVDLRRAAEDLAASLAYAERSPDPEARRMEVMARHNLGYVDFLAGRIPAALGALERAQRDSGELHPTAGLDRARVLREAGLFDDAEELLARVGEVLREGRLWQDLGETELVRAECALVAGDLTRARSLTLAALRRFARRGNVRWERKAELLLLRCEDALAETRHGAARVRALRALVESATAYAERCRVEGRRDLGRMATLVACEARLRLGEGATEPLPRQRASDPLQVRLQTREVRALAAFVDGRPAQAAAEVRAGLAELGGYQQSLGSLDLRTASAVHGSALARLGLDIAWETGSPARVLALIEQARAVSTRLPPVSPPGDEITASLLSDLRQVEEDARALEGDPAAEDTLAGLRVRAGDLQRRIRARAWEIEGGTGGVLAAPRPAQIRSAAHESGTAFVSFARRQGRWVAVTVCGRRTTLHDLGHVAEVTAVGRRVRADLDALALPMLPAPLRASMRRSLETGLARLDALLLAPLPCADRAVVVSVSGDLVMLPWGLLPSRVGHPTVVTPSAASWLRGRERRRPSRVQVVAVGGPDLHRSTDEAARVATLWPEGRGLTGTTATTAEVTRALVGADLVHVAAHGTHRQDNPLFSSVRLADGHLYAYELDAAAGLAGCVVLSACEAGLATIRPGDESLGLSHVLLQLGTASVISGVSRVADDVAADLMERLHRALSVGDDSAMALARAQEEALRGGEAVPFVAFGATW